MKKRNRFIANLLAIVLAVTSIQFPALDVQAQELYQEADAVMEDNQGKNADKRETEEQDDVFDVEENDEQKEELVEDEEKQQEETEPEGGDSSEEESEDQENADENDSDEDLEDEDPGEDSQDEEDIEGAGENTDEDIEETDTEYGAEYLITTSDIDSEAVYQEGTYEDIKWVLYENGKLTVTGTGDFAPKPVAGSYDNDSRAPWYKWRSRIYSAEINVDGMTDACYMFNFATNLTSVDFSGSDLSSVTNMSHMFSFSKSLVSIDWGDVDVSNVTDMSFMFEFCSSLTSIDFSDFNTEKVESMSYMFWECSSLTSIDFSNFKANNLKDMTSIFDRCSSLTSVDFSGFNAENVESMSYMFVNCSSLTSIDFSNFKTKNLKDMSYMFFDCSSLISLDLSGFDTSNVSKIEGMFSGCTNLISLDVSNFDASSLTSLEHMFDISYETNSLKYINLSNFKTDNIQTMRRMFDNCNSLVSLDLSSFNTSKVTDMSSMFNNCSSLVSLDLSSFDTSKVTDMSYMFNYCSSLTVLDLSAFDLRSIKVTGKYNGWDATGVTFLFNTCTNLNTIYTPINLPELTKNDPTSLVTWADDEIWYRADGTPFTQLPIGLKYSIVITKDNVPDATEHITASKRKTAYGPDEEISTEDITVMYYDGTGKVERITSGFTTNLDEIDQTTLGKKILTVTYSGLSAEVELFIANFLTESNITITIPSCVYDATPQTPTPEVTYHADGQSDTLLVQDRDYTVSYENNVDAGSAAILFIRGTNSYSGTVMQYFDIEKAKISESDQFVTYEIADGAQKSIVLSYAFESYGEKTGYKVGTPIEDGTIAGDVLQSLPTITTSVYSVDLRYYLREDGTGGDFVTVPITVSFENYQDAILYVKIILRDKDDKNIAIGEIKNIHWVIDENGKLTVTGTGDFKRGSQIYPPWNRSSDKITSAEIKVTGMTDASYMFSGCFNLTELDLSGFETSEITNMSHMFSFCRNLTKVNLGGFNTGNVKDMSFMFYLSMVEKLDLSHFDTHNVKDMQSMFWLCSELRELDISGFITDNVENMSDMFMHCDSLEELDVSHFNTEKVTDMSGMFGACSSLTELDVSNFKTENVTNMSGLFGGCSNITELNVSGWKTDKVTSMGSMFNQCSSLTELDVSSFNTSKVAYMTSMFMYCAGLKELNVRNFNTANVRDISLMFYGCSSLKELDISNFDIRNVTNMEQIVAYCDNLTSVNMCGMDASNVIGMDNLFLRSNNLSVIYTPCNINTAYPPSLPTEKDSDVWYRSDTEKATKDLPTYCSYSILLTKNKKAETGSYIMASKAKTNYQCGDTVKTDDLTVMYFGSNGRAVKLTSDQYTTNVEEVNSNMSTVGVKNLIVEYRPTTGETLTAEIEIHVTLGLTEENTKVILTDTVFEYNGYLQEPEPNVTIGTENLIKEEDYKVFYQNNLNAGTATINIIGTGNYSGKVSREFTISKRGLTVRVNDVKIATDEMVPKVFAFDAEGLADPDKNKDDLISLSYIFKDVEGNLVDREDIDTSKSTSETGIYYYIIPTDVNAGKNYNVNENVNEEDIRGILTIMEELVLYSVTFNMMGHGEDIDPINEIKAGSLIEEPVSLTEGDIVTEKISGENGETSTKTYVFTGWYKDTTFAAKQKWNFDTDTVQANITLYACWLKAEEGMNLYVKDIEIQTYTGSTIKPTVYVYDSVGGTLLKSGKDYTITYKNNVDASVDEKENLLPEGIKYTTGSGKTEAEVANNGFKESQPYVLIKGKGNYAGNVYLNFSIQPAGLSADDENMTLASGFVLKYSDQLVKNNTKTQNPFSSLKYKKAMTAGKDYTLRLEATENVKCDENDNGDLSKWSNEGELDSKGKYVVPVIPKGYYGTFTLTITGKGNYKGTVQKDIYVTEDASGLMKNATITLGKNQKSQSFEGERILTPGYYDTDEKKYYTIKDGKKTEIAKDDIFTVSVKNGKTVKYLEYDSQNSEDGAYFISYQNNNAVGTATMIITGNSERGYFGSKSVTFKLTGKAFNAKNVTVKSDESIAEDSFRAEMPYTGKAITQNKVLLTNGIAEGLDGYKKFEYGTDYTISYKNNIKKGTATMTFTAKPESGYSGSFKMNFKITPQSLLKASFDETDIEKIKEDATKNTKEIQWSNSKPATYSINGATLSFALKNEDGTDMKQGTDYTVSYKDNKAVTVGKSNIEKNPTLTIKGKGNYEGTLTVTFQIQQANIENALKDGSLTISASSVEKKDTMKFKDFKFKVLDGKKALSEGAVKDYMLDSETKCSDTIIQEYAKALETEGIGTTAAKPTVIIEGVGNYTGKTEISLADYIYVTKLTSKNLYVIIPESTYTGEKLEPTVTVCFIEDPELFKTKKDSVTVEGIEKSPEQYGLKKLKLKTADDAGDYIVTYGANNTAGKNKGSVTVTGTGIYGGSVTVKFMIQSKNVYTAVN